jgi:hypothetical protein
MTLVCRDTKLGPVSGCITMSLTWRTEPTNPKEQIKCQQSVPKTIGDLITKWHIDCVEFWNLHTIEQNNNAILCCDSMACFVKERERNTWGKKLTSCISPCIIRSSFLRISPGVDFLCCKQCVLCSNCQAVLELVWHSRIGIVFSSMYKGLVLIISSLFF